MTPLPLRSSRSVPVVKSSRPKSFHFFCLVSALVVWSTLPALAVAPPTGENAYYGKGNVAQFGAKDGIAELPKACYYTALDGTPSLGKQIRVSAKSGLAAAIEGAKCGDTLLLPAGASFDVKVLPSKKSDDQHYITVRTDTPDSKLPPEGTSISPVWAGVAGMPTTVGTFNFTGTVTDAAAKTATGNFSVTVVAGSNFDGPAELPRVTVPSAMSDTPAPGAVVTVNAGGDLQSALNNAHCGDTIKLQAGATFTGQFSVPAKNCAINHWIIIRTSAPDSALPAEGQRATPCYAGVASLPGRPQYSCANPTNVMAKIQYTSSAAGPFYLADGANYYRFIGLEVTRQTGAPGKAQLFSGAGTADHIIIDRSWFHGLPQDETYVGVAVNNMRNVAIVDSYFTDFKCYTSCSDALAILGGLSSTQDGPFKIKNNFIESSGENVFFGGGAATMIPADIQILHNHFWKPLTWMPAAIGTITESGTTATMTLTSPTPTSFAPGQTLWISGSSVSGYNGVQWTMATVAGSVVTFTATSGLGSATGGRAVVVGSPSGSPFIVKNLFELKNGIRVLFEANLLENVWGGFSQNGYGIVLSPKNSYNLCSICTVADVTIRYSRLSHAGGGMIMADVPASVGGNALEGDRYSIHDVVMDDINASTYNGAGTLFEIFSQWTTGAVNTVTINHVTGLLDPTVSATVGSLLWLGGFNTSTNPMFGFIFTNNIVNTARYPVWSTGGGTANCASPDVPLASLNACFPVSPFYTFSTNALLAHPSGFPPTSWPTGNFFPATGADVLFVNYNNGNGGNYELQANSPYKNKGTDGKDLGADIVGLNAALANVE
jgi:hypothetical protein